MVLFHPNNCMLASPLNLLNKNVDLLDHIIDFAAQGKDGKSVLFTIQLTCKTFEKLVIGKILLLTYRFPERPLPDYSTDLKKRKLPQCDHICSNALPVIVHLQSYIARGGDPRFVFKTALSKLTDRDVVTRASMVHLFWLFTTNRMCPASRSFTTAIVAFSDLEEVVRWKAVDICTFLIQRRSYIKEIISMATDENEKNAIIRLDLFQKLVQNNYGVEPATQAAIKACTNPDPNVRVGAVKLLNDLIKRNNATNEGFEATVLACKGLVENVLNEALPLFRAHFEKNWNVESALEVAARACSHPSSQVRFNAVTFIKTFVEKNYAAVAVTPLLNALPKACEDLDDKITSEVIQLFSFLQERDCGHEQALVVALRAYSRPHSPYEAIRPKALKLLLALVERNYQLEKVAMATSQGLVEITVDDVELCSLLFAKNHGIEQAARVALRAATGEMSKISEAGIKLLISLFGKNHGIPEALGYAKHLEEARTFSFSSDEQLRFCIFFLYRGYTFAKPPLRMSSRTSINFRVEFLEALVKNGQGIERAIECLHTDIPMERIIEPVIFDKWLISDELFTRLRSTILESEKSMGIVVAHASQMCFDLTSNMEKFDPNYRKVIVVLDLLYAITEKGFYLKEIATCLSKIPLDVESIGGKVMLIYKSLVNRDCAIHEAICASCLVKLTWKTMVSEVSIEAVYLLTSLVLKGYALEKATEVLRGFVSECPVFTNRPADHVYTLCTALLEKNCDVVIHAIKICSKFNKITVKKLELLLALVNRRQAIDLAFEALSTFAADASNVELQPKITELAKALKNYDTDYLVEQFSSLTVLE